ncbi:hypothetical protein EVAR_4979_1 [Eumeta japonica]|uniref:Uncharacterized protein n=1 Tax=Eumeta variegata TaxID=151549 RepID=A0A4C1UZ55_EUMVA|nr:hypothetical protein EVAR_4979_1 [Eumeta japonica]
MENRGGCKKFLRAKIATGGMRTDARNAGPFCRGPCTSTRTGCARASQLSSPDEHNASSLVSRARVDPARAGSPSATSGRPVTDDERSDINYWERNKSSHVGPKCGWRRAAGGGRRAGGPPGRLVRARSADPHLEGHK